jgi:HAE1 family hydrophobic/amphiphilic exporter-1
MFFIAVVLLGVLSLQQLSVDLLPDISYPRLLVRTRLPDAAPEEVMEFVTRPVEQALGGVSGVKRIVSRSREGLSLVSLEFYWGRNMDYAALSVREKLDDIRALLPERAERPQVLRLDPSAQPIMQVAAGGVALGRLTELCRQIVRRRLEQLPGVALVDISGGVEPIIEVQVDPQKLLTQNITIEQIGTALRNNNLSVSGGTVKKGRYRFAIRLEGEFQSPEDIRQTALSGVHPTRTILLGDIARIRYAAQDPASFTRLNGRPVVGLLITKEAGSNTVEVSRSVQETLAQIRREIPEVDFTVVSQQADFIRESIANVFSTLLWGGVLAFVALLLFLGNLRHPLNIGISMPVSIIVTFFAMRAADVSLNLISLGGLALGIGMLVDNSIVVLENIFRLREEGQDWVNASINGAAEVAMPVTASTLTTCAVFLPIIYVEGLAGQLFRDQSLTVVFSLLASLVVALTLLPVLASRFKGRPQWAAGAEPVPMDVAQSRQRRGLFAGILRFPGKLLAIAIKILLLGILQLWEAVQTVYLRLSTPVFRTFERGLKRLYDAYHRLLLYALNHKITVLWGALAVLGLSLAMGSRLNRELLPPLYPDEVRLHVELPAAATLHQTAELVGHIEAALLKDTAVAQVFSRIGSPRSLLQSEIESGPNEALLIVRRHPHSAVPARAFVAHLRRLLPTHFHYLAEFESGDVAYREMLGLQGSDIQIDVKGDAYAALVPLAEQIRAEVAAQKGFKEVRLSHREGGIQYLVRVDRDRAALYGIQTSQVAQALQSRVNGVVATRVNEGDQSIEVVVRPVAAQRDSWNDVYHSMIQMPNGLPLPLREVIRYQRVPATEEILRQDQEPVIRIEAALEGLTRREAIRKIEPILAKYTPENTEIPVRIALGGQQEELQASLRSIGYALLLSIVLVYLILAAQFESLRYPLLILLAVPFGWIGAIWLLAATGVSVNVISGIGLIVLTGIVVNDAIIKVDFINQARQRGASLRSAILEASEKRFRPILITTLTTVLGLLPMWLSGGSGAELRQPLAIVVIGGLTLATVLTLVIIPVVYEAISVKKNVDF